MPPLNSDQDNEEKKMDTKPIKWWQWVLLYPTLFVSIFAAIPTYIEAYSSMMIGVQFGDSKSAKTQYDMWKKNLSCTSTPSDPLITANNTKVDATICKTGDVLVKIFTAEGNEYYRWVDIDSVMQETAYNIGFIGSAYAGEIYKEPILLASNKGVICQKFLDSKHLLRRVSTSQGCFDEIVNTYTGRVESKKPAACNSQC